MRFYEIDMEFAVSAEDGPSGVSGRINRRTLDRETGGAISKICEKYSEKIMGKGYFFLSHVTSCDGNFGMIIRSDMDVDNFLKKFSMSLDQDVVNYEIKETTLRRLCSLLHDGDRNGYVYDDSEVLREYELEEISAWKPRGIRFSYDERLIREKEKEAIYRSAESYFTKKTFLPELDRIYLCPTNRKYFGHPVDYMIESDDERTQDGMINLLLQSLFAVGRIENHRYCDVDLYPEMNFSKRVLEDLYNSCVGGAVVLRFSPIDADDEDISYGGYYFMEDLCKVIRNHCCDVLTIICLPQECSQIKSKLFKFMGNFTFVEIKEELAFDEEARDYLKARAKEFRIRTDKKLFSSVESGCGYLILELNAIFDEWYSRKLKKTIYSQYSDFSEVKSELKNEKPKGKAYEELESMVGLRSAKEVIHQALDSYKAQRIFKEKGMGEEVFCNHMIFTGNPGTAKTTVARLFSQILKDNKLLARGHIIEVGRGDLVGKYVGWTAQIIKRKFKEAEGGILFIDEAYSLVDDRNGSFGDEAINTIVQEMENHRDELIVIFAGYPDKMELFLDKNPGMRSRISHYVHFEDYDTDELCQIAEHIAKQKGMVIEEGAMEKIKEIMEDAKAQTDFGNGRYVRNIIEKARMAQNSRLVRMDYDQVTAADVKTIIAEDIKASDNGGEKRQRQIGFMAA